jgi:hypothetical protein
MNKIDFSRGYLITTCYVFTILYIHQLEHSFIGKFYHSFFRLVPLMISVPNMFTTLQLLVSFLGQLCPPINKTFKSLETGICSDVDTIPLAPEKLFVAKDGAGHLTGCRQASRINVYCMHEDDFCLNSR